jgi:hypothetical protein
VDGAAVGAKLVEVRPLAKPIGLALRRIQLDLFKSVIAMTHLRFAEKS